MIKLIFVGGSYRAIKTLGYLINRSDVQINYAVFMKGMSHEHVHCEELCKLAQEWNIPYCVNNKVDEPLIKKIQSLDADLIYGGGVWRSILPENFFNSSKYGYIGLHGTALPEYRGMAGINWQIMNGEPFLRMRMLKLSHGIDDGNLISDSRGNLLEYSVDINNEKHLQEIFDEYDVQHLKATGDLIDLIKKDELQFISQDNNKATYSCHFGPDDAEIDWNSNSLEIFNLIRSQSKPYNGAYTFFNNEKVFIYRSRIVERCRNYKGRIPGKVVERSSNKKTVIILTKDSALEILEAETTNENNPVNIFNSIRKKCTCETEAIMNILKQKNNIEFK